MNTIEDIETNILIMGITAAISYCITLTTDLNRLELFAIINIVVPGVLIGITAILYFLGRLLFKV